MSRQILNNNESGLTIRTKINENFKELYSTGGGGGGDVPIDIVERLETLENVVYNELTAPVTATGNPVQLDGLVGGLSLKITADIVATQAGTGTPSFSNIRPITGHSSIQITHNEITHDIVLPKTIYGLDGYEETIGNGQMTEQTIGRVFSGTETWAMDNPQTNTVRFYIALTNYVNGSPGMASHAQWVLSGVSTDAVVCAVASGRLYIRVPVSIATTVAEWKAYLATQYAAGTPVTVVYRASTPSTTAIELPEILSLNGTNTVYTNGGGNVTVEGRQGWKPFVSKLTNAILELGGTI